MSKLLKSRVTPSYIEPPTKPDRGVKRVSYTTWQPDLEALSLSARAALNRAQASKVINGISQSKCRCAGKCECGL